MATPTSQIYTLSLHDALPILARTRLRRSCSISRPSERSGCTSPFLRPTSLDRKSTRLNSSHRCTSYAVFCLKKKSVREQRKGFLEIARSDQIAPARQDLPLHG